MGIKFSKIAITGSTGFIGANLLKVLDKSKIGYVCFKGDLLNVKDVNKFFSRNKPATVIHLAGAFFGSKKYLEEVNVATTKNLLDAAVKYGLKKIIYSSTGAVYGEPTGKNSSRETDTAKPNTDYGKSKLAAENNIRDCQEKNNITAIILRFPNVYGPGNEKGVIFNLLDDIKNKGKINVFGDGKQTRQFLHVLDACRAILLALKCHQSGVFNITNGKNISINAIISKLQKKYDFEINYKESNNNLKNLSLNPAKSLKILHFKPVYKKLII